MRNVALSAVVGMGLLIVIVTIFIVYGLIQKQDDPDFKFFDLATEATEEEIVEATPAPSQSVAPASPIKALGDLRYEIPSGFKVVEMETGHNRIIIQLENEKGQTRLMILNMVDGAKVGTITLDPAPAQ